MQEYKNRILSISNLFIEQESEGKKVFMSVPSIHLYKNDKTALFINENNKFLNFDTFWANLMYNKNLSLVFFENSDNVNKTKIILDKDTIFNKITSLKFKDIIQNENNDLPIYEIYQFCLDKRFDKKKRNEAKFLVNNFEPLLKNTFFNLLTTHGQVIMDVNKNFIKGVKLLINEIKNNKNSVNYNWLMDLFQRLIEIVEVYQEDLFKSYIDFYLDIDKNHSNLLETYETTTSYVQKKLIFDSELKLKYMNAINSSSLQKIANDLKIRDYKIEIKFYKEHLNKIKTKTTELLNYFISKTQKEINILKIKKVNIYNPSHTIEIYKDIFTKKKVLHLLKKNYHKLMYLGQEELLHLNRELTNKIKIFINNNIFFNKNKAKELKHLKWIINSEFQFNISEFVGISHKQYLKYINIINGLKQKIKELKHKKFKQLPNYQSQVLASEFQQKIKHANAELAWNKKSELRLFNKIAKSKELKLSRINTNLSNTQKEIHNLKKFLNKIIERLPEKNEVYQSQAFIMLQRYYDFFTNTLWMSDFVYTVSDFCSIRTKKKSKFIQGYVTILNFIEVLNTISLPLGSYLKPYNELQFVDKTKLKLFKDILNKIKIIFVVDDKHELNKEVRLAFLKILFKLSEKHHFDLVFITTHLGIVKKYFNKVHFFDNYSQLEGGRTQAVLKRAVNPWVKKLIDGNKIPNVDTQDTRLFIYDDIFYINDNHYIYSSLKQYQKWTSLNVEKYEAQNIYFEDLVNPITTQTTELEVFTSVFEGKEILLTLNSTEDDNNTNESDSVLLDELKHQPNQENIDFDKEEIY
ncbi:hypothetical protein GE118_00895 [Mycoplasma sp. NEAQ87857]|uniref:MAG1360 family OppF-related protein n=1 Tax=Mycoplasma sp. NEAQ87857 TaxID=2683967 RepID=UPI001316F4A8|nr:hypothetical protein [Mycoplasma sp. NEAQ87857]QGZ97359.1 hypothetical protein GE118_00895 [Mycoplasma sp. NEAQ87857]